jgi:phytoene dehydrogenase-like protein
MPDQTDAKVVAGAWRMTSYVRNQEAASLNGVLLLMAGRWSTLYFFRQPRIDGTRGRAESGRYRATGDQLCFHYEFKFQGGGGKPYPE